jgi:hypothetical protein
MERERQLFLLCLAGVQVEGSDLQLSRLSLVQFGENECEEDTYDWVAKVTAIQ